jgi:hypothetical protein
MDLVADTNVWYDIGAGTFSPSTLKNGNRLLATPVNHLEICSNLTARSFSERKAAASAILNHRDDTLEDPETHLANLWGIKRTPPSLNITADLQRLASAANPIALHMTVPLYPGSKTAASVGLSQWRTAHWDNFRDGIVQAIDTEVSGYAKARANGRFKYLPGKNQPTLKARLNSAAFRDELIESTYRRVLVSEGKRQSSPTKALLTKTSSQLGPYASVYAQYIIGCACTFAPQPNDFGDLESFLYLQHGRVLLTSEKRWHKIAKAAGYANIVVHPRDL